MGALGRRCLFRSAAAGVALAALSGCAVPRGGSVPASTPRSSSSASSAAASAFRLPVWGGPARLPHVVSAFQRAHPGIVLTSVDREFTAPYSVAAIDAQILQSAGWGPFAPLDEALRAANFNPSGLLPGIVGPYIRGGSTLALPFAETPWAVQWRTDAFTAAGLPSPTPEWTIADFESACVALQPVVKRGDIKGVQGVLQPLAFPPSAPNAQSVPVGALDLPGLWQAFAWGYGGSIVANDRFALADPRTVQGLEALVGLQRHAAPGNAGAALAFSLYRPGALPSPWRWARLPRFPVDPVVTTVSYALGLAAHARKLPAEVLPAAVTYLLWLYEPATVALVSGQGDPPAVAGAAAQAAYWSNKPDGGAAAGDWAHFRDCYTGFPSITPHAMDSAISSVLFHGADLAAALAGAEEAMNSGKSPGVGSFSFVSVDLAY